jgi:hypothetical protein
VNLVVWMLTEHHVGTLWEVLYIASNASFILFTSGLVWLGYVAIEPFVRRQWPQVLVSWARLLAGDWRDPLVGRDIVIGCTAGVLVACLERMENFAPALLGYSEPSLDTPDLYAMNGPLGFLERVISGVYIVGVAVPLNYLFFLCVLRILLRNTWACRRRRGARALVGVFGTTARRIRPLGHPAGRARRKHRPAFRVDSIRIPRTGSSRLCVRRTHLVSPDVRGIVLVRGIRLRGSRDCRSARVVRLQDVAWRPPAV